MTSAYWSFSPSPWPVATGLALLLAVAWMGAQNIRRNPSNRNFLLLELLKIGIAGLLVFTLFKPEYARPSQSLESPMIAVLCDDSDSMKTRDVLGEQGTALDRRTWLASRKEAKFWAPLEKSYQVVVDDFSAPKHDAETGPPESGLPQAAPASTTDPAQTSDEPGTDINEALEAALKRYQDLRAIILVSDGDWNMGKSPVAGATRLRMQDIPVFAVAVGNDKFLPDLELQSVSAPAYGLMDEHVSLPFTIQSRLTRDVRTTIRLHGPAGPVAERNIVIPAMSQFQDSIVLIPRIQGERSFSLKLPIERDEVFRDNNTKSFNISFRREILKALLIETTPRWEYRFLHNALSRDPGVRVHCLLLHPGMRVGAGKDYLSSFPGTKETLSQYDVVFIGDIGIGPGELTQDQAALLKGLVEQQGSGLVFLPGITGKQATLIDSPLGELLPIVYDTAHKNGFGFGVASGLALTSRGRGHLLTLLASSPAANEAIWKSLPGFFWHAAVTRAKPGADVLAVHSSTRNKHGRIPLLVTQPAGSGKILFMGTDSAWRWRRGVEDTHHYRFWGQVVRWMAHQRHLAHQEGIRFFFSPEAPSRRNRIFLHATVANAAGFPLEDGVVKVSITSQTGHREELQLTPMEGGWGVFTGFFTPLEGGRHDVFVECEEEGRQVKAKIDVSSPTRERIGRPARPDVLREIATITQGRFGTAEDLQEIVKNVSLLPKHRPHEERLRLWCHPVWGGLIVGFLALYWMGRKLIGRV